MGTTRARSATDGARQPALEVVGLGKSYGDLPVLRDVDLTVERGEVVALLGANGAGKTTLLSTVAGLLPADRGDVRVCGHDVRTRSLEARRCLGYAAQELSIYPILSVRKNLRFFGELRGLGGAVLDDEIDRISFAFELTPLLDRDAGLLSGGEKRRLHTAISFLGDRPLLVLDEPTAGSDVETRATLLEVVKVRAAAGSGVVYSTHYLGEVEELGASVAILDGGRIIAHGALADLVDEHGVTVVEVRYERPPATEPRRATSEDGLTFRIASDDPAAVIAKVTEEDTSGDVRSIEVVRPSLESVFLKLAGRRYSADSSPRTVPEGSS